MTTRDQWNSMSEQSKWDYCRLLEDTVDALELDGARGEEVLGQWAETQAHGILPPYMYERSIKDASWGTVTSIDAQGNVRVDPVSTRADDTPHS